MSLKELYKNEIKQKLADEFEIKNPMLIPALEKITISVGLGEGGRDKKYIENVVNTISTIAGQKAVVTTSKKSIAGFKLREGMEVGVKVTLRKDRMYNFLKKLIAIALPRVRDFKGVNRNGFDGRGNFSFGLTEQLIFPEIKYDEIIRIHGMNITITTTTESDKEALRMLEMFGFPFTKGRNNG
jgi:large subunit ribosomal protein L5